MIVAITGASGFVGRNLAPALAAQGRQVRALVQHPVAPALVGADRAPAGSIDQVRADVLHPAALRSAFAGAEVVYHLAARISVLGDPGGSVHRVNVEGTRNVVNACLATGVRRLVHFSSIHALDPNPRADFVDENRPLYLGAKAFAYERSKATGEREVIEGVKRGLDAVIINPTGLLGPYDFGPSRPLGGLLNVLRSPVPILVDGGFDWVDVRDVVAGSLAAEMKGRTGERYLLSGRWVTVHELTSLFSEAIGVAAPRIVLPMWMARSAAALGDSYGRLTGKPLVFTGEGLKALISWRQVSRARAESELEFRPRPLEETVDDTVSWLRSTGRLSCWRSRSTFISARAPHAEPFPEAFCTEPEKTS